MTVVDVAAPLAALGTTIQVPTLDGDVPLEMPAGTQPGETIMMAGRGLPPLGRGRTGDLRVVVNVVIPRKPEPQAARPARAALRLDDRGEPARAGGDAREAQAGAGRVIRLGIRVRAADAEIAFARLEPVLAGGAEEVDAGEAVEFAVYGEDVPRRAAARAGRRHADRRSPARRSSPAGTAPGTSTSSRVTVGALTFRPPWLPRRRRLVIEPGLTFGAGLASRPRSSAWSCCQERERDAARRLGLRAAACWRSRPPSWASRP